MAKQKAKLKSKAKSAAKSAPKPKPQATSKPKLVSKSARGKPARKPDVLDPVVMTVIANRLDGIVREMTNTLLRAARSAVISSGARFLLLHRHRRQSAPRLGRRACRCISSAPTCRARTCRAITRATSAKAMLISTTIRMAATPIRPTTPSWCRCSSMTSICSRPSPNAIWPTSATAFRRAISPRRWTFTRKARWFFPGVRIQRDYKNEPDIMRMCRARIRVPDQWYGDALAALGSARIAERRLKELCRKYGAATIKVFIKDWFDYSERRVIEVDPQAADGTHYQYRPFRSARRHPARRSGAQRDGRDRSRKRR